jgi:hypothetical protein
MNIDNRAVHLLPYLAMTHAPRGPFFFQGFAQLDIPLNSNAVTLEYDAPALRSSLPEQTLVFLDASAGVWLYRNPAGRLLTGLASILEIHYNASLNDSAQVTMLPVPEFPEFQLRFSHLEDRLSEVNMTVGLHAELARQTLLRVGGVFPLSSGDDRAFDAELQVQLERRF